MQPEGFGAGAVTVDAREKPGQIVAPHQSGHDREEQAIGDEVAFAETGPEAAATRRETTSADRRARAAGLDPR